MTSPRRVSLLVAAAFMVALSAVQAVPSAAAQTAPEVGTGGLSLISRSVQTTDSFELGLQLPGVVEDDDVLIIAVHEKVVDRAQFRATLTGDLDRLGLATKLNRIFAVAELQPTIRGSVVLEIDRLSIAENLSEPGVYPVSIELRTASQEPLGQLVTHLVRIVDEVPDPTRVALTLLMDIAPNDPLRRREIVDDEPTAGWIDLLTDNPELPFTVQPTPWLFDEYRTDPRMRRLISRLGTAEVIAAPYVPLDEVTLSEAGLGDRVGELFERGIQTVTDVLGSAPITTRWLSQAEPTDDQAALWHARGVREVVVPGEQLHDGPAEIATDVGSIKALVAPSWFSDADPDDTVLAAHHLLAELAVIALTNDVDTSSVMVFGNGAPFNRQFMDELLRGFEGSAVIRPVTLSEAVAVPQLVEAGSPMVIDTADVPTEPLAGDLPLYQQAVSYLESYRSMISDADTHWVYDDVSERLLLSLGSGVSGERRDGIARQAIDKIGVETGAVEAPPLGGVSLTSRTATAPFSFRNTAAYPLRVEVRFIADKARFLDFDDEETTTIVLEPGVTNENFRVEALSAGSFPLRIEMFSPDGALELRTVDLTMRSTVPSGVGVALTIGAIIVLVAWWGRDLIRGRRRVTA